MEQKLSEKNQKERHCLTKKNTRDQSLTIRLDKAEYEMIKRSSSSKNLNISTFCRQAIMDYISVSEDESIDQGEYFGREETFNSIRKSIQKDTQKMLEEIMSILLLIIPSSKELSDNERNEIKKNRDKRMELLKLKFEKINTLTEFKKDE